MVFNGRTDLASEAHRLWRQSAGETSALPGVRAEESRHGPLSVTAVEILDERGQQALGKPPGLYYTLELPSSFSRDRELFSQAARLLSELLGRCFPFRETTRVLIAALGNPDITPDAVGPLAASHLLVTRHLKQEDAAAFSGFASTVLCRTGVLGTTGLESAAQIQSLCRAFPFDCVLVLDALAEGISAHAARGGGENALYKALEDISILRSHEFGRISPKMGKVHLNVTQIQAGTAHNVIPDRCSFVVDIRPTEQYSCEEILDELQSVCKSRLSARNLSHRSSATCEGSPLLRTAEALGIQTFTPPRTGWFFQATP